MTCVLSRSWQDEKHLPLRLNRFLKSVDRIMQNSSERLNCSFLWKTTENPVVTYLSPNWVDSTNFKRCYCLTDIIPMFSDIWKLMANLLFTLSKTQEKHEVHHMLPCTRKMPMNSLFSWKFFCSFPVCANASFSTCFPTELLTVNVMKTWYLSIIFLLHENAGVELVFLNVFP